MGLDLAYLRYTEPSAGFVQKYRGLRLTGAPARREVVDGAATVHQLR
jgi:hypothetical protein